MTTLNLLTYPTFGKITVFQKFQCSPFSYTFHTFPFQVRRFENIFDILCCKTIKVFTQNKWFSFIIALIIGLFLVFLCQLYNPFLAK